MMYLIQTKFNRNKVAHELPDDEPSVLLPNRVPSLLKIAENFISGRPIDQSLQRNLDYNPIEGNPMLQKGIDLADVPKIAKSVGQTLEEATEAINQAKVAKGTQKQVDNPASEVPVKVETAS